MGKKPVRKSSPPSPPATSLSGLLGEVDESTLAFFDLGVYVVDAALNLVMVNDLIIDMIGQSRSAVNQFIGQPLTRLLPELGDDLIRAHNAVFKEKRPGLKKGVILEIGGREIIVEMRIVPLLQANKVTHLLTTIRDITEPIRTQEALAASEEKYRLLVENVNAHISIIDREGIFLFVNDMAARASGVTPNDVLGKSIRDFFPEETAREQLTSLREVIDSGEDQTIRIRLHMLDKWLWFDANIQPFRDPNGRVIAAMVIAIDITRHRQAEEALRKSEEQLRLLIDNVRAHIFIVNYDGEFLFSNKSAAAAMNLEPQDMIGKTQRDLFPPDIAERQISSVRRAIDSGHELRMESHTFVGRAWKYYDINIQPYNDAVYGAKTALIIAIDITHRLQAEEKIRESEERFRLQFKSLPIPAYIWEHDGNDFILASYNIEAEKITQGKIPDFVGKSLTEMYGSAPQIVADMNRCLQEKETITREMPYHMVSTGQEKFLRLFYVYVPPNLVVAHTDDITEHRLADKALQDAHDELEKRVRLRTEELAEANEALRVEREALEQKNIAMREVLDQIEEGKKQMASQIQANVNRIALPILKSLEGKVRPVNKKYVELLRTSLTEIASPLIGTLESKFSHLTPRELEVCNMVKNGLTSKEIAETFNTSVQTVLKQRAIIRRKLGIANDSVNLASYLKSLE